MVDQPSETPEGQAAEPEAPVSDFLPNPALDAQFVAQTLKRPDFDPKGKLVARTELRFGDITYFPTAPLPSLADLAPFNIDERTLLVLWRNGKIDTYPNDEEAAAVTNVHGALDASGHDQPLPGTLPPKLPPAAPKKSKR